MKIVALSLILAGSVIQAGGALFAVVMKGPKSDAPWTTLTWLLGLAAGLLIAGLICRRRTTM